MREFTAAQKKAIDKNKKSLLVSAAAGSGKTTVLVERVCSILSDEKNRVAPDEILVVTFTRTAASEMKERISNRLRELIEESPGNKYLKKQQMLLSKSNISTIDSFCQNLVKEYFYLTDIDRDFKFLSDADKSEISDEAISYTVEELYKNYGEKAVGLFNTLIDEKTACEEIKKLYAYIYAQPFPYDFLEESIDKYTVSKDQSNFYLDRLEGNEKEKTAKILPELKEKIELFAIAVKYYSEKLMEIKKEKNQYDFSDIEHVALSLLYKKDEEGERVTDIGKSIADKLAFVLVDEYQDTNELQDKIFRILSQDGKNLFVVGDSKQSIYGFRQANPEIFINLKNADDEKTVNLSANFRSEKAVCDSVNSIFDTFDEDACGGIDYKKERLIPKAKYAEDNSENTEFWIVDRGENRDSVPVLEAELISQWINEKIQSGYEIYDLKIGAKRPLKYGDVAVLLRNAKDKGEKYKDIFIKNGIPASFSGGKNSFIGLECEVLLDLLRAINNPLHDIHLFSSLMSPFFSFTADDTVRIKKEGKNLYSSLIISAQEGDEKSSEAIKKLTDFKAKAMSMPLNLFIEDIYLSTGYYAIVGGMSEGSRRQKNLSKLVAAAEDYSKNTDGTIGGFIRYAENLQKNSSDSSGGINNDNVVNIVTGHKAKGLEFPVCFIAGTNYSVKPTKRKRFSNTVIHSKSGIGLFYYEPTLNVRYLNAPYRMIAEDVMREAIAEELRLLYVQMTRAKNKLIMIYSESLKTNILKGLSELDEKIAELDSEKSLNYRFLSECNIMGKIIYSAIKLKAPQIECKYRVPIVFEHGEGVKEEGSASAEKAAQLKARFSKEEEANISNTPAKITASEINRQNHGADYNFTARPSFMSDGGLTPAQKGTALHTFMQYCDFKNAVQDLESEIERLFEKGFIGESEKTVIDLKKVADFFEGELFKRIEASSEVLREKQFTVLVKANELLGNGVDEEIVVQGICDLAFVEDDKLTIIDYKTDSCNNAGELFERYKNQLFIYAKCLEKATGKAVGKIGIYSFSKSELYEQML